MPLQIFLELLVVEHPVTFPVKLPATILVTQPVKTPGIRKNIVVIKVLMLYMLKLSITSMKVKRIVEVIKMTLGNIRPDPSIKLNINHVMIKIDLEHHQVLTMKKISTRRSFLKDNLLGDHLELVQVSTDTIMLSKNVRTLKT